jgi:glycine dehydrogenase subunit 1
MYLASLGKTGLRRLARLNYDKSEYLKARLRDAGMKIRFDSPTFNEFVVELPPGGQQRYEELLQQKIVAGFPVQPHYDELENCYLLCATETKTREDMDRLVEGLRS